MKYSINNYTTNFTLAHFKDELPYFWGENSSDRRPTVYFSLRIIRYWLKDSKLRYKGYEYGIINE